MRPDHEICSGKQDIEVSSSESIQSKSQQSSCEEDENIEYDQNIGIEALASLRQFGDTWLHLCTSMDGYITITDTFAGTGRIVALWNGWRGRYCSWMEANDEASKSI